MSASGTESSEEEVFERDDRYPLQITYCEVCGYPPEYCEFGSSWEKCKVWIEENCPELLEGAAVDGSNQAKKKKNKGPGGGATKNANPELIIEIVERTKRKKMTYVSGLPDFNIKPVAAAKQCRVKFATGCNPAKDKPGSITMNGDLGEQCAELFKELYADQVKPEQIFFLIDGKKSKAF